MPHGSPLLVTIVASLGLAYVLGVLARLMRLPPMVGFVLAGVVIGPYTPGFVADQPLTAQMAEIGVALLLFGVGLHFSFNDLMATRRVVIPGAVTQVVVATGLGAAVGHWIVGLDAGAAAVMGLALAIASTAVATRALEERGRLTSAAGTLALGWLVVQDVIVVVALVFLPVLATGGESLGDLLPILGRVIVEITAFAVLMLVVGRRVLPAILGATASTGSRELFTLAVIVVALGVAWASSSLFGVSLALGAFFAGVVLGESDLSHQAAAETVPIQQVFTVLFFVSVGMLFDPSVIVRAPLQVLAVLLTILVGTGVVTLVLLLVLRTPLSTAATVASSLAQIGEFSFILSELAVDRGLLPAAAGDLVLAAALLAICINPLTVRAMARLTPVLARSQLVIFGAAQRDPAPPAPVPPGCGHAIVVGYGRVGRTVVTALTRTNLPVVVLDADKRRVERLKAAGVQTVWGDATRAEVMRAARPADARVLVVALPDAFQAREVITTARAQHPAIVTLVRTHSDAEAAFLTHRVEVGLAVMGEREIALSMSDYTLRRLGLTAEQAQVAVDALREAAEVDPLAR